MAQSPVLNSRLIDSAQVKALESRLQHEVCSLSEEKQTVRKLEARDPRGRQTVVSSRLVLIRFLPAGASPMQTLLKSRDEIREIEYRRSAINERSAEKEVRVCSRRL